VAVRERLRKLRREARFLVQLRVLPPRVALFQWRAWRLAWRSDDRFSQVSTTRPRRLQVLLSAARGRKRVVELGTATAWTAISLALADSQRTVLSYDPIERQERERYLRLVPQAVRERLTFVTAPGDEGPPAGEVVDLLYVDSSHELEGTISELQAWRPAFAQDAVVVLDDFANPDYPGVAEAVHHLGLEGEQREGLFVHRAGASA
jgi:predicted O-methyltransferase YrrM